MISVESVIWYTEMLEKHPTAYVLFVVIGILGTTGALTNREYNSYKIGWKKPQENPCSFGHFIGVISTHF